MGFEHETKVACILIGFKIPRARELVNHNRLCPWKKRLPLGQISSRLFWRQDMSADNKVFQNQFSLTQPVRSPPTCSTKTETVQC